MKGTRRQQQREGGINTGRSFLMKALIIVLAVHAVVLVSFLGLQGCSSTNQGPWKDRVLMPKSVDLPPQPVMPPAVAPVEPPVFKTGPAAVVPPPARAPRTQPYYVKKGDTLSKIAARYGLSSREVIRLNNLTDPDRLLVGQVLKLPADARPVDATAAAVPASAPKPAAGTYVVQRGDSLSQIASRHGIALADLKAVNGLTGDRILEGQKLLLPQGAKKAETAMPVKKPAPAAKAPDVPVPAAKAPDVPVPAAPAPVAPKPPLVEETSAPAATGRVIEYTVYPGDTIEDIAVIYSTTVKELMMLNNFKAPVELREGQRILVPLNN